MVTKQLLKKIFISFLAASLFISPAVLRAQQKYNVLFIAVDDMNNRLSFLNGPFTTTPNLQRLLSHGMNFTMSYCQYPLCSPSRTSILTGFRPDKTKIYNDKQRPRDSLGSAVQFLPEYFRNNGYHTERYGKILHGTFENDCTWDYAEPPERNEGSLTHGDHSSEESKSLAPDGSWWIDNIANDTDFSDGEEAVHLVTRMKQPVSQPFFYAYGAHFPHNPFTPSLKYWNLQGVSSAQQQLPIDQSGTLGLTGNGSGNYTLPNTPPNDRADVPILAFNGHPILIKTNDDWKNTIHAYDGEVQQVDAQIGLLLDEMDRQNLWANTVVVFWSDHGQHLGEHEGLWKKETLFNEALQVPLIVCVPGKPGGTTCSRLVEYVDLYPTLAELCGLPAPSGMEGSSFARLLDNPTQTWKRAVFSQLRRNQGALIARAVYTEQYHYNIWDSGANQEELYDRIADPFEYTNLATNSAYASALANMRTILAEGWTKSLPPSCTKTIPFYRDADGDGYGTPNDSVLACQAPVGYVSTKTDCNDNNASVNPGAPEICGNRIDDNCNGQIDENNPKAKVTPLSSTDICQTGSVVLRSSNGPGYTFQWVKDGVNIPGATKRRYLATATGKYKVIVTVGSCSDVSKEGTITNSCGFAVSSGDASSIQSKTGILLSVYPNPSTGKVNVSFNSSVSGNVKLNVYDFSGRLLVSRAEQALKGTNTYDLNLSTLASGIYYIELQNGTDKNRVKFIIDK